MNEIMINTWNDWMDTMTTKEWQENWTKENMTEDN